MNKPFEVDPAARPADVAPEDAPNGFVFRTAVCHTKGCQGQGIPNRISVYNNADGIHRAVCGWCGQPCELRQDDDKPPAPADRPPVGAVRRPPTPAPDHDTVRPAIPDHLHTT